MAERRDEARGPNERYLLDREGPADPFVASLERALAPTRRAVQTSANRSIRTRARRGQRRSSLLIAALASAASLLLGWFAVQQLVDPSDSAPSPIPPSRSAPGAHPRNGHLESSGIGDAASIRSSTTDAENDDSSPTSEHETETNVALESHSQSTTSLQGDAVGTVITDDSGDATAAAEPNVTADGDPDEIADPSATARSASPLPHPDARTVSVDPETGVTEATALEPPSIESNKANATSTDPSAKPRSSKMQ